MRSEPFFFSADKFSHIDLTVFCIKLYFYDTADISLEK